MRKVRIAKKIFYHIFFKFAFFGGTVPTLKFLIFFSSISREFHKFQILKSRFLGQFLTLKNMVEIFFRFWPFLAILIGRPCHVKNIPLKLKLCD